jgi:ABC-type transporter Mla subunit MlaD
MTTTAKILVVLNLLLAVLFLGFSAASMQGRLNMQASIKKLEAEKRAADDKVAVERAAADKADVEAKKLANDFALEKKSRDELKKQTDNQFDNMQTEMANYRKMADVSTQRVMQVTAESTQRKEEIDQARKQNQELVASNVKSRNELSDARDQIQELKAQIERLNDKVRIGQEEHRKVLNYLAVTKVRLPPPNELENLVDSTPPPNVEGVITDVRDNGKYLAISIGENDGVKLGHTFQIFRRQPDARFVGYGEVKWTRPNEAVIRPTEPPVAPPQKGDRVGISSLLNRG